MRSPEQDADQGRRPAWRWVIGLSALLVVLLVVGAFARPRRVAVQIVGVQRQDLLVPVQCDGTLEPFPGGELRSPEAATVAQLYVRDGDRVVVDAPLVRLENPELSQKALDARSEALAVSSERAQAQADLANLQREEKHAREIFEADTRLLAAGAITRAASEADERALREVEEKSRAARARAAAFEGPESRLALSQRASADLSRRVAALTFRAPLPGVVYGLPRRAGESVAAGQVVASVVDPEHRRLRARVDQPDLPRIAPGQRILVTFDGLPHEHWDGKVIFVAPGLSEVGGREVGEVLGEIGDPKGGLPTNAAVDVQIVTGEKSGTLVVPRASVLKDGERRFVYRLEEGRARRRNVQVGLTGLNDVEIVDGLKEKDSVILPGSVPLSEGLRVRATGT
ncbi:MAG: efflux RND transporter periplasmic adaptor subunit [Acidobacteriota bacterium]